jgi:hypothetical protein
MKRMVGAMGFVAVLVAACGQAQADPLPSFPPAPTAPTGWVSLASVGSTEGPGFAAFKVQVSGRPLALDVTCTGIGTLVVTFGDSSDAGPSVAGQEAVTFPCSTDAGVSLRHEIAAPAGPGEMTVSGGIVPGAGALSPSVFVISLEEATP